ncbi:MAG: MBL fold metallo-hydrolase [Christensenellaceae bacterium]|nr:MBL fold metallo-hydrolase [Christensenellaceae bacterium]
MSSFAVLTANAGLLLNIEGKTVLLDAVHTGSNRFSGVTDQVLDAMISGDGDFARIDYMIITHDHPDHVSLRHVNRFLKTHPETVVFSPLKNIFGEHVYQLFLSSENYRFGDDHFYFRNLIHDGVEYKNVRNYGGVINIAGKKISFFGDAAIDNIQLNGELGDEFDLSVFNFPFLTLSRGRDMIKKMDPKGCVICHIPFEYDDVNGYRDSVSRVYEKYGASLPPMRIMTKELQKERVFEQNSF